MNTFKLAQLSDIHAGYRSGRVTNDAGVNVREQDGYQTFSYIVRDVIEHDVDAVLICGDVYHTPTPDIRSHLVVQSMLRKLADANIPVYMLSGNHDTNDVRADIAASRVLHDPLRNIYSHAEPYVHHEISPGINLHLVSHHMYGEQASTMNRVTPVDGEVNLFATHGSCVDPFLNAKLNTEASPREIVIPDFLLNDFAWNYCLLGHIHERGWVGSSDGVSDTANKKAFYNGSIIRRGFSDKQGSLGRGWTLWSIESDGTCTPDMKSVPQRPQFDFEVLDASYYDNNELTERIIANLRSTQTKGKEFDVRHAPILRQTVVNLSPEAQTGLDWKAINEESQHALSWKLHPSLAVTHHDGHNADNSQQTPGHELADMVESYDTWVDNSSTIHSTNTDIRETVQQRARDFVKMGQEHMFEDDG